MAAKKTGASSQGKIDFNLDKLEQPEELKSLSFAFRGKRFVTVNPADIPFEDLAAAHDNDDYRQLLNLFLGEQAEDFWAKKPSLLHIKAFGEALEPMLRNLFGADKGEPSAS